MALFAHARARVARTHARTYYYITCCSSSSRGCGKVENIYFLT
nr:MAG TPA: hypothetical protein [Microviridae sp.]